MPTDAEIATAAAATATAAAVTLTAGVEAVQAVESIVTGARDEALAAATEASASEVAAEAAADTAVASAGYLYSTTSGLASMTAGTALSSPVPTAFAEFVRDSNKRVGFGIADDGSFYIGKYDANLNAAVMAARGGSVSTGAQPFIYDSANVIYACYSGGNTVALTTTGTNGNCTYARRFSDKIGFLSDRYRSITQPYTINYDGTSQRIMLRSAVWEATFGTGQSNGVGWDTAVTTNTKVPIYSGKALKLTGGPVIDNSVAGTSSPSATIDDLYERTRGTWSSGFAAGLLDSELSVRPTLKHVCFGNAKGGAAYSTINKGTAVYNDVIDQAERLATLATAAGGSVIVRAMHLFHGEADATSATYAANLTTWLSDYDTDIKAATGQKESLFMFLPQVVNSNGTSYSSCSSLAMLAASRANSRIVLAVPGYIFDFLSGQQHYTAAAMDKIGEYLAKAYKAVVIEGKDWTGVRPKASGFTLGSNYVDIQFDVQSGSLVLDTAFCTDPGNYGFTYSDGSGRTISSVAVTASDTVRVTLSGTIGTSARLDYAYTNNANVCSPTTGQRGCLRDSDTAVSRFDGSPLYNPCAIFAQLLN